MGVILLVLIIFVVSFMIFYLFKKYRAKEGERTRQDQVDQQAEEKRIHSQQSLHEKEKKRWEDEYWKRQAKGER
ncbi:MAG: hypothetical protein WC532_08660 [Candidatus Omnitrophota bacterium]